MTSASIACERKLLLRVEPEQGLEVAKLLGAALGGGTLARLLDRFFGWRKRRAQEPVELTARILDDGDKMREQLFAEVKDLRAERDVAVERAHQAEVRVAVLEAHEVTLRGRLNRKDEQNKALVAQLIQANLVPVVFNSSADSPGAAS